jgi:hypothetical protein
VTILSVSFEEIRLLGQIADGHKIHSGPERDLHLCDQFSLNEVPPLQSNQSQLLVALQNSKITSI